MDRAIISIGVAYTQLLDDVRAVIRHELQQSPAPTLADPQSPTDNLLSIREAAVLLGVTVQSIHSFKKRGILPYHKLASRSYIKREDIMAALQSYQRNGKAGKGGKRG